MADSESGQTGDKKTGQSDAEDIGQSSGSSPAEKGRDNTKPQVEGAAGGARREPGKMKELEDSDEENDERKKGNDEEEEDSDGDEDSDGNEGFMSMLQNYFMTKLHLGSRPLEPPPPQVLDEVSVEGVVKFIQSGKCKNIITMAGAGISTSAGIPDFRSPGSGLYSNLKKYDLPFPEAIFDIQYFRANPKPFFVLAKELYPGTFNPTPSHWFLRMLHNRGLLLRHYTQNIDTLEHVAGLPAEKLVEAHGTFRIGHCLDCHRQYTQEWMKEEIFSDRIPTCENCSGLVKPDIVFFREALSPRFFSLVETDFPQCDLLIILGTSLTVQPFAMLINNVPSTCPRLLVNREKAGSGDPMMAMLQGVSDMGGLNLDSPTNTRDVALLGECDDGCRKIVDLLGWQEDFEKLMATKK